MDDKAISCLRLLRKLCLRFKPYALKSLSIIVSSIFFASLPMFLTVSYMSHHGFFSYDYFASGTFGMQTFSYVMMAGLLLISLMSYSWLLLWMKKKCTGKIFAEQKPSRQSVIGSALATLGSVLVFITVLRLSEQPLLIAQHIGFWLLLCLLITIQIGTLMFRKIETHFPTLMVVIGIISYSLIFAKSFIATGYGTALRHFQVGGGSSAKIVDQDSGRVITSGSLLLLTPERAFIKAKGSETIQVINRTNTVVELSQRE